jgi:uncharacterized protein (TIGR02246 family)
MMEILSAIEARWKDAFARHDAAAQAALYTEDALFYGGTMPLREGRSGVHAYFVAVRPDAKSASFSDWRAVEVASGVIVAAGIATFLIEEEGNVDPREYRITWVLVERGGEWLIANHHVSRRTA